MKKLITMALAIALCCCIFCGCGKTTVEDAAKKEQNMSMFVLVEKSNSWHVYYHRETKVMYVMSASGYNFGTFTVMVNPDGTPLLWED